MARRIGTIAALLCSNAAAFVELTTSRSIISGHGRAPLSAVEPTRAQGAGSTAPTMRYVTMNTERESSLAEFSGFKQFMLLKVDNGKEEEEGGDLTRNSLGYTQFITHTVWAHKTDFEVWRRSQDFKKRHGDRKEGEKPKPVAATGSRAKMGEYLFDQPVPAFYHAVIIEPVPPEHAGGEPS